MSAVFISPDARILHAFYSCEIRSVGLALLFLCAFAPLRLCGFARDLLLTAAFRMLRDSHGISGYYPEPALRVGSRAKTQSRKEERVWTFWLY